MGGRRALFHTRKADDSTPVAILRVGQIYYENLVALVCFLIKLEAGYWSKGTGEVIQVAIAMAATAPMRVAFLGLGYMGSGMAANLMRMPGVRVTLWNRTASKCDDVKAAAAASAAPEHASADSSVTSPDADIAETVAEATAGAQVVCVCLASESAGEAVLFDGEHGVWANTSEGAVIMDHSTVSPAFTQRCHEAARAVGARFLDAPISGGPEGAANATLAIMCGGEEAAFTTAKPVLNAMGKTVRLLGGPGAGTAAKLANQLLVGVHAVAAAEALALASRLGLTDVAALCELLENSYGNSRILQRVGAIIAEANASGARRAAPAVSASGAPLRLLTKDLKFIDEAARSESLALPTGSVTARIFAETAASGGGENDMAVQYYRLLSGEISGDAAPEG